MLYPQNFDYESALLTSTLAVTLGGIFRVLTFGVEGPEAISIAAAGRYCFLTI